MKRKSGERTVIRWMVTVALLIVFGAILFRVSWKVAYPFVYGWKQRQEVARLEERDHQLRDENEALQEQHKWLSTEEGAKQKAREKGYLKPGEHSLRFIPPPSEEGFQPEVAEEKQPRTKPQLFKKCIKTWLRAQAKSWFPRAEDY